jgi:hypothetical protein
MGASGVVEVTAPFPGFDPTEAPIRFVAITLTKMLDPQGKSKGVFSNSSEGIVHYVAAIIIASDPSQ